MNSNVTLKLDDALLKQARKVDADENTSLSGWVAGLIVENLRKRDRRRSVQRRSLATLQSVLI